MVQDVAAVGQSESGAGHKMVDGGGGKKDSLRPKIRTHRMKHHIEHRRKEHICLVEQADR